MQRGIDIFEGLLTSAVGTFRTCQAWLTMSGIEGKADLPVEHPDF
jgi:hypothetical protein